MKITVKKNLIVFHKPHEWYNLADRLRTEYGQSIMLISARCKRDTDMGLPWLTIWMYMYD